MDMVYLNNQTMNATKVVLRMVSSMDLGLYTLAMVINILETGSMIKSMEKVFTCILMGKSTKVNGKKIGKMDKEGQNGQTDHHIKANM